MVSYLSAKTEYNAMASTTCELVWLTALSHDFSVPIARPICLFCDNKSTVHIANNPVSHERAKYIEIDCHVVLEKFQSGLIRS